MKVSGNACLGWHRLSCQNVCSSLSNSWTTSYGKIKCKSFYTLCLYKIPPPNWDHQIGTSFWQRSIDLYLQISFPFTTDSSVTSTESVCQLYYIWICKTARPRCIILHNTWLLYFMTASLKKFQLLEKQYSIKWTSHNTSVSNVSCI